MIGVCEWCNSKNILRSICKCKNILIGVHPYDLVAIRQMDELFSQDEYDTHYMTRRANTTIIACDVVNASPDVFASSMGTATVKDGYDILLTDIGDAYVVDVASEKGEALMGAAATDASDADIAARKAVQDKNDAGLNKHELKCAPADIPATSRMNSRRLYSLRIGAFSFVDLIRSGFITGICSFGVS